jgi:dTDP-4-amino-4,6-dideoxygalactose transaminase
MAGQLPILDLSDDINRHMPEFLAAFEAVLKSGHFIIGPNVSQFEAELGAYLGTKHAIGCNSGTDALVLALRALGIGAGDEVITTPFTFFATAEAISLVGATPVFVDIDARTFNIDPDLAAAAVTERTKALMPVHLFGLSADMPALMALAKRHDLRVIEDVAQAMGASCAPGTAGCCQGNGNCQGRKVGTIGDVGAYSFFPSKNLGAFGDGGLVTTDDDDLAASVRMLRAHGAKKKYANEVLGYNSRLDEVQAAMLRVKLPYLDENNAGRQRVAGRYNELLDNVHGVTTPVLSDGGAASVFHQYTIRVAGGHRDALVAKLAADGISTMVYYPTPVHRLPVYAQLNVSCPLAEAAAGEVMSLPIWPTMSDGDIERVAKAVVEAVGFQ